MYSMTRDDAVCTASMTRLYCVYSMTRDDAVCTASMTRLYCVYSMITIVNLVYPTFAYLKALFVVRHSLEMHLLYMYVPPLSCGQSTLISPTRGYQIHAGNKCSQMDQVPL